MDISKNTSIDRDQGIELTLSSVAGMFDTARKNLELSLRQRRQAGDSEQQPVTMLSTQAVMQLAPQQAEEFISQINELVEKFSDINNPDGLTFGLAVLFNPNYHMPPSQNKNHIPEPGSLQNPISGIDDRGVPIPPQI